MKRNAFIKDVLEKWNIQCYVMASLVFQMILVFLAPMRRWVKNGFMYLVIWAVYLLASFFSTFALSLIYNNAPKEVNESDIFPFWAPFLLVHLGGPHTITALAMEDNNLWHRHMLAQVVQVFSVLVVFYQYQIFQSEWLLPTAIVFLVGIVKCFERIGSLQLASFNFVRRSIRRHKSDKGGSPTTLEDDNNGRLDNYEIVRRGYDFYETFRGFIIDHTFIQNECGTEKEWFSKLSEEDAFKVMEMELNFMYQAMFTKMIAVQYWEKNNYFWCIWRFVCHALLVTVAVIFFCHSKHHLQPSDIAVTYCLLGGAVLLDQIALIHLIFSHWTMVKIMDSDYYKNATAAARKVVRNKIVPVIYGGLKLFTVNKCWSGKIIQYSFLNHSLKGRWKWAEPRLERFSLKEIVDSCLHTKTAEVGPRLKKLVVEDIKRKAAKTEDDYSNNVSWSVMDIILPLVKDHTSDYATFVLILHVATEICYFTHGEGEGYEDAKLCMQISQYLAYLLVLEERITSALPGTIGMRFKDICWEQAQHTFDHLYYTFNPKNNAGARMGSSTGICSRKGTSTQKAACEWLMENSKGNTSTYEKSVLPKAVELASAMNKCCGKDNNNNNNNYSSITEECAVDPEAGKSSSNNSGRHKKQQKEEFWTSVSEVWVGLLVYASSHCRGDVYYLNKGGQFYTFVRLLMAHFGLQERLKGERSFQLQDEIHY